MGRQAPQTVWWLNLPKLSVILPVKDASDTLREALGSLLEQTYRDFDVLIYDDGSRDETPAVIHQFIETDSRFRLIGDRPVGIVEALRRLTAASDAPYLARMDGDDISHPERFADTLALFDQRPELAVGSVHVSGFPAGALGPGMARYIDWLNSRCTPSEIADDMFVESPLCHPAVIMRREPFEDAGGYLDDGGPEDYGLWLRLHRLGYLMAKTRSCRFFWRDSQYRLSRTDPRYDRGRFLTTKIGVLEALHLQRTPSIAIWGAGKLGRQLSRILAREGHSPSAFIDVDPKKVGHRVHGAMVRGVPKDVSEITEDLLLIAVGAWGAREKIRRHLLSLKLVERCHFICVA